MIGEEQERFTRQLLLFWLKALLFHSGLSSVIISQSQANPEVMIPFKILDSPPSKKPSEWVSYRMKFDDQEKVVHMRKTKFLFARNMPVFTYTDQGTILQDHPFIQNNCYYYGYVQGDLLSQVSLNSCFGGFDGILQKNNTVYKIEPKLNSTTFEHLVYKLVSEKNDLPARRCGSIDDESQCEFQMTKSDHIKELSISKQSGYVGWWLHKRYLRVVLVVDNKLYHHYRSNTTFTKNTLLSIMNVVSANYVQFDITITLAGIEIWTDKDLITQDPSVTYVVPFCKWKEKTLNLRTSHHSAQLLSMIPSRKTVYYVFINTICDMRENCAAIVIKLDQRMDTIALTITRTIATNLGVVLDKPYCDCGQKYCIMYENLQPSHVFSNCSYAQYYESITQCLLRPPKTEETLGHERCGNGELEEGEDCDCGTISSCANDPCCEANCKLAQGAICAFGLCCRNCKFLPAGTMCRKKENECDLPEWCNGTYHKCPEDFYVQGGISCKGGGFCYRKKCITRQEQCRRIFGDQAKSASLSCYVDVNNKGDRFGNCAYYTDSYTPCAIKDSQCGRLQCENANPLSNLQSHSTVISTNINGVNCWGIEYHYGAHTPDLGEVEEGTECGENHICVDRRCVPLSYFTNHCSPEKCSMHGICNNRHHCHCDSPWRPPFCYEAGNGAGTVGGGSVDSGPPSGSNQDGGGEGGGGGGGGGGGVGGGGGGGGGDGGGGGEGGGGTGGGGEGGGGGGGVGGGGGTGGGGTGGGGGAGGGGGGEGGGGGGEGGGGGAGGGGGGGGGGGDSTEVEDSIQSESFKHSHICYFLLLLRFMVFLLIFIVVMLRALLKC